MKDKLIGILKKLYKIKYKVRIIYYGSDKYKIQWASYRFIRIWNNLYQWGEIGSMGEWIYALERHEEAVELAKKINTEKSLIEYYKPLRKKAEKWKSARIKYKSERVPFRSKIIIK